MPKKLSRRNFLKKTFGTLFVTAAAGTGGYYYACEIEPKFLDITTHTIHHPLIPAAFHNKKIIQFSDTHLGFHYDLPQLKKLVQKINSLSPDIVFFTGDLMDEPNKYDRPDEIAPILSEINAPLGKFAIYGNHDHGGYGSDIYKEIMNTSGFTLLLNEHAPIKVEEGTIYVAGIDDAMLGRPDIHQSLASIPEHAYTILLSHAPDLANTAASFPVQLQLSGHSHGGQIQLPFLGALVKPPYGEIYYEGFYEIGDVSPLTLYVNRGIGTTRLPMRFLARPELSVFTIIQA